MKNFHMNESRLFTCIVILFSIISIIVLGRTVLKDMKSFRNEGIIPDRILDTLHKDPEFIRLVDTVIVTQEKLRVLSNDSLRFYHDEVNRLKSLPPQIKVVTRVDTVWEYQEIPIVLDDIAKKNYVKIDKRSTPLYEYHDVKYNNIKIHTIPYRKFGLSFNLGYGAMYGIDDSQFHHGPYVGAGIYYRP